MSYCSRVYRHRNAHTQDEQRQQPFFSKQNDTSKANQKSSFFQAKLSINKPGDKYEQEADSVANAVVNKQTQTPIVQQKKISGIQRLSTSKEEEKLSTNDARMEKDKKIQEKPMLQQDKDLEKEKLNGIQKKDDPLKEEEKNKIVAPIRRKSEANASTASPQVSSRIESSAGKGNTLPAKTLSEMNSSFGVDFSNVRIHKDSESVSMNKELQAQAFTHGNDIYFNSGKYNPENSEGKFLLAHELTHVVQQQQNSNEINRQSEVTNSGSETCDQKRINQLRCVINLGGCPNTRPGGIPSDEEINTYNESCRSETNYNGPNITPSSDECTGPIADCFDDVYICSKDLDTSPVGKHAFFRVGGAAIGNITYSLQPMDTTGSDCWQGVPGINYSSDMNADAVCDPTPISKSCLLNEFVRYPIGHYCTWGPNSNTFVGHIAKNCGVPSPDPDGITPGLDDSPPPRGTFAPDKWSTLLGCETKQCNP